MVRGLNLFKEYFHKYNDRYMLIGGIACHLLLEQAGLDFRATRDFDIVLCVETMNSEFTQKFWEFIKAGGYTMTKQGGGRRFYRFDKPEDERFPTMLEIFSRQLDAIDVPEDCHLTPIPTDGDISSLSAILMDNDYYDFIHSGKMIIDDICIVDAAHLIPLKVRAWIDLSERRGKGDQVDSKTIAKHKKDIFTLYQLLEPTLTIELSPVIRKDMQRFLEAMRRDIINLLSTDIRKTTEEAILDNIASLYGV